MAILYYGNKIYWQPLSIVNMIWSTLYPTDGLSHVTEVVLTAVSVSPAAERRKITSKMCFFEDLLPWNGDTKENMEMSNDLHNITAKVVMFLHTMRNFMKKVQSKWIKHRAFELYDVHDMSKNCTLRKIKQNSLYIGTGSQTISFNVNWGDVLSEKLVNAPIETRGRPGDPFWWICGQSWVPKIWFSRETQQWNILSADKNTMKSSIFWWILQGAMARSARPARQQWRIMDDFSQVLVTLSWIWITVDWLDHENIFKPS